MIRAGEALRDASRALVESEASVSSLEAARRQIQNAVRHFSEAPKNLESLSDSVLLHRGLRIFSPVVGEANPQAVPVRPYESMDGLEANVSFDRRYEGPRGHVHGGQTALILDEFLALAMLAEGRWGMTGQLSLSYLLALPLNTQLKIWASTVTVNDRKTRVNGGIRSVDGKTEYVSAEGLFVTPQSNGQRDYLKGMVEKLSPE